MSEAHSGSSAPNVTVGRVINRVMSVTGNNFPVLFLVTALFYLPALWITYEQTRVLDGSTADPLLLGVGSIVSVLLQFALIAAVTFAVYAALRGEKASFGATLGQGLKHAVPVIAVSMISGIAIFVGLLLLIVPGVIAVIMLSVAVPALIAERAGIFGSLSRSAELTKGHRWMILGVFVVWVVFILGITLVGGMLIGLTAVFSGGIMVLVFLNWILSVLYGMIGAVIAPVLYFELRVSKEGLDLGDIASVFD